MDVLSSGSLRGTVRFAAPTPAPQDRSTRNARAVRAVWFESSYKLRTPRRTGVADHDAPKHDERLSVGHPSQSSAIYPGALYEVRTFCNGHDTESWAGPISMARARPYMRLQLAALAPDRSGLTGGREWCISGVRGSVMAHIYMLGPSDVRMVSGQGPLPVGEHGRRNGTTSVRDNTPPQRPRCLSRYGPALCASRRLRRKSTKAEDVRVARTQSSAAPSVKAENNRDQQPTG